MKPVVLFFARDYQAKLFPSLHSDLYKSVYVVLNKKEKQVVIDNGGEDIVCYEEEFDSLNEKLKDEPYLKYSFGCDRNYIGLKLEEREIILKKTISFWRIIIEKYNPSLIINETIAIEISEVLAIESKAKGIRYLSWMSFSKKNTFYWQPSPYHNSLKSALVHINPLESELKEAKEFIIGLKEGVERPFYVKNKTSRYSLIKVAKSIWAIMLEVPLFFRLPKLKRRVVYGTNIHTNLWNIKLFLLSVFKFSVRYDNLDKYKEKELILYPLHYEPEAVLFYMAYFFDNQVSVVENTLKCLAQNQILVIKEHPQQPGVLLEKRFQDIKKRYPNLIFINSEVPITEVMKICFAVITLGSTAGFEALALGKKVINLGRVFYDSFKGVNNCKSFEEVYNLIRGIVPFKKLEDLEVFVAKMLNYTKHGNPFPHDDLYNSDNIEAIKNAIENELVN